MKDPGSEESMITAAEARELIDDVFEEEALVIGGMVALHELDEDAVWGLIRSLDIIRGKALRRLEKEGPANSGDSPARGPNLRPHPAIEDFLLALRGA